MAEWVDFADIRRRVSLERVLGEYYKLEPARRSGNTGTRTCPIHGGTNPRSFHIDFERNLWHCFTKCGRGGNQLDLVAAMDQVSVREAALRLKRHFLDGSDPPPTAPAPAPVGPAPAAPSSGAARAPSRPPRPERINPPLEIRLQLAADHPHITVDRRLLHETAAEFGIGYCNRGILAGCIAIPIHDHDGELVAYAGRRLKYKDIESQGKYRFPAGFHKDRVLYGLHRIPAGERATSAVALVEGFFSVLKLHEAGVRAAAIMGADLSVHQAAQLRSFRRVLVLLDGNPAGRRGTETAARLLPNTTLVLLPDDWEPEQLSRGALQSLVELCLAEPTIRRIELTAAMAEGLDADNAPVAQLEANHV